MTKKSSKEKILAAAREYFSSHGFKGTSVRMISDKAGVNVASINYHFNSKESLFNAVMTGEAMAIVDMVTKVIDENTDLGFVDLSEKLFIAFSQSPEQVVSCMKLMLSFEKKESIGSRIDSSQREVINCIHKCLSGSLNKEFNHQVDEELLEWGSDAVFMNIAHIILRRSSGFIHEIISEKEMSIEVIIPKVRRLACAVLREVESELN